MLFNCVEPMHENVGKDFFDWKFSIKKGFSHRVAFAHVDTCLGVVCYMGSDKYFFGHINGFFDGDFSENSHKNAFLAMMNKIKGETVNRAIIFGDIYERTGEYKWGGLVNPIPLLKCKNVTIMDSSNRGKYSKGIDVLFDIDNSLLTLMPYQNGRDFKSAAKGIVLNMINVKGVNRVQC